MAGAPSETLKNRTYVGLILAQFTNSFNDQASHIIGNFFACDMLIGYAQLKGVDEKLLVAVVTLLFIVPLLLLSPLAGILADKLSKRDIVVTMKCSEVTFMFIGLVALLLPRLSHYLPISSQTLGITSAVLIILVVFLMGVQTAFLVPAKYGIMPEILHTSVLSRGNGILEGTSFVAQLAGTSVGGILYSLLKRPEDLDNGFRDSNVWIAGAALFTLAILGTIAAFMMRPVPAAAPNRKLTLSWIAPLRESFAVLGRSKPLALAVIGIAFFAFMTLYARQSLLYEGETRKQVEVARQHLAKLLPKDHESAGHQSSDPLAIKAEGVSESQRAELRVSVLIAMVGLGIGVGSLLAGYLSGSKLELGLVPIGGIGLVLVTGLLAFSLDNVYMMFGCLIALGVFAGLYVVPMYTMMQQRAPKAQKGVIVATSNFVNVAGGIIAILTFYILSFIGEGTLGELPSYRSVKDSIPALQEYIGQLEHRLWIPRLLFAGASVMTAGMLYLICRQLPDFFTRALLYAFSQRRYHLRVEGLNHLPQDGPAILVTNSGLFDSCVHVIGATDRYVHFYLPDRADGSSLNGFLRLLSRLTSTTTIPRSGDRSETLASAMATLKAGDIVGLGLESVEDSAGVSAFFQLVHDRANVAIVPVFCDVHHKSKIPEPGIANRRQARVAFGDPLDPSADADLIRAELLRLERDVVHHPHLPSVPIETPAR